MMDVEWQVVDETWRKVNLCPPERTRLAAIATVQCPRCEAAAGARCRIMKPGPRRGKRHPTIHRARVEAWHAEGMPVQEVEP